MNETGIHTCRYNTFFFQKHLKFEEIRNNHKNTRNYKYMLVMIVLSKVWQYKLVLLCGRKVAFPSNVFAIFFLYFQSLLYTSLRIIHVFSIILIQEECKRIGFKYPSNIFANIQGISSY